MSLPAALWKYQPGDFFFISTKSATKEWKDTAFRRGDRKGVDDFIRDNRDKDLYFCPHGFSKAHRRKEYAVMPRMLWSDMDETDPRTCRLKPSIALESSPKRYVGLWLVDKSVTEHLNKRLTHYIGADRSGCDVTQVLRIPGTFNYKYQSTPRVRTLWDDGPTYKVSELEGMLPEVEEIERVKIVLPEKLPDLEVSELSPAVQRALRTCERMADRSLRLIYVARAMVKDHYEVPEIASVLMMKDQLVSEHLWDQKNPRRACRRAIERALGEMKNEGSVEDKNGYVLFGSSLAETEREHTDWLWYPYLARGEMTILEGDPGEGKSYMMQMVGGAICDGRRLPSVRPMQTVKGRVFFADTENRKASITKARLNWNGIVNQQNFYQEDEPFVMSDTAKYKQLVKRIEELRPVLVVFDTINLYIGGADTSKASETTQALQRFNDIARRYHCSVVVVRHLTKDSEKKALYRGQGSIAFAGVVRIIMTCGHDKEDEDVKTLGISKPGPAGKKPPILEYTINSDARLNDLDRSLFAWGQWRTDLTVDDTLAASKGSKAKDSALAFLKEVLADGAIEVPRLEGMAQARNIARATLYRAAKTLGIVRNQIGSDNPRDRTMKWSLPSLRC